MSFKDQVEMISSLVNACEEAGRCPISTLEDLEEARSIIRTSRQDYSGGVN